MTKRKDSKGRILKTGESQRKDGLQDYRDQGRISYIRLGGKILYKVSDIEKLLEDNYHEALI